MAGAIGLGAVGLIGGVAASGIAGQNVGRLGFQPGGTFRGPQADPLAIDARRFLQSRLSTPAVESPVFNQALSTIRATAQRRFRALEQRINELGPRARSSGRAFQFLAEASRANAESEAIAASNLIIQLEQLRDQGVFQFLSAEAQQELGLTQLQQAELERRQRANIASAQAILGGVSGSAGLINAGANVTSSIR